MASENAPKTTRFPWLGRWRWRYWLVIGGFALLIGSVALRTGVGTFIALWEVLLLMGALVIVTIPTRTVTTAELLAPFSLGCSMISVSILAGLGFDLILGTKETAARALGIPLVEEVLKIAPVLWILWRQRERRTWTFGATDILLLAAASGAGFYWVEEAFIIHNHHSSSFVGRFPTTDITSNFVANHALWTAIAGLTIGISLLLRGSRLRILLIGVSGLLWSVLDHAANNYNANFRGNMSRMFRTVTGNGNLSLYIFLLGVGFALALDSYFVYFAGAKPKLPPFPKSPGEAKVAWRHLRLTRQLAYVRARYKRTTGLLHLRLIALGIAVTAALRRSYLRAAAKPTVA